MRSTAATAELALLLEVAGTPKPGNVDRARDLTGLHFEHFLAGAVGARPGLDALAGPPPADGPGAEASHETVDGDDVVGLGDAFERAVAGMSEQSGGNTQFGALLALAPLVRAAGTGACTRERVRAVVDATTVADTVAFYRAFDHVDVFVGDPPPDAPELDVRRGSDAIPDVRDHGVTLGELMADSAHRDGVAAAWTTAFDRAFAVARDVIAEPTDSSVTEDGASAAAPVADRAADAFLALLAQQPDTFVAEQHGDAVAAEVTERAAALRDAGHRIAGADDGDGGGGTAEIESFADELVERGVNPGTTADLTAAALFVALERHGVSP
jgi:triphosphoribosyl-dephospho-CoA synthase